MKNSPQTQEEIILQLQQKFGSHILEPVNMGMDEHGLGLTLPRLRVEQPDDWFNLDVEHRDIILKNFMAVFANNSIFFNE
jgi:hypothetical protein